MKLPEYLIKVYNVPKFEVNLQVLMPRILQICSLSFEIYQMNSGRILYSTLKGNFPFEDLLFACASSFYQ